MMAMLSEDRFNNNVGNLFTHIQHPPEATAMDEDLIDEQNDDRPRFPRKKAQVINVLIPSPNKWNCFSIRDSKRVSANVITSPQLTKLGIMNTASSINSNALEINNLFGIEQNPKGTHTNEYTTQLRRTSGNDLASETASGCRRLTLREKLAQQRAERAGSSNPGNVTSSDNNTPSEGTPRGNRSKLPKAASFDVSCESTTREHQPAVRSHSDGITEKKKIFGFKILKGAPSIPTIVVEKKTNDRRSSSFVSGGNMRQPRQTQGRVNGSRMREKSNTPLFYTPKTVPTKNSPDGSDKVDETSDKDSRSEENRTLDADSSPSVKEKMDEVANVNEEQRKEKKTLVIRKQSLEEGKIRLQQFREKQRRGKLTKSFTNPEAEESERWESEPSSENKDISESLAEIRHRIRERRRKREQFQRSKSLPESESTLDKEGGGKEGEIGSAGGKRLLRMVSTDKTTDDSGQGRVSTVEKEESEKNVVLKEEKKESEKNVTIEENKESKNATLNGDMKGNEDDVASSELKESNKYVALSGEKEEEQKDIGLNEEEEKREEEGKVGSSVQPPSESNLASGGSKKISSYAVKDNVDSSAEKDKVDSTDGNKGNASKSEKDMVILSDDKDRNTSSGDQSKQETKKPTKRERRKMERYQRSKTMSAIMYNDIHSSAKRELQHKDASGRSDKNEEPLTMLSVSEIKKRFLENEDTKISEPGLFYASKVSGSPKKDRTKNMTKKSDLEPCPTAEKKDPALNDSRLRTRRHTFNDDSSYSGNQHCPLKASESVGKLRDNVSDGAAPFPDNWLTLDKRSSRQTSLSEGKTQDKENSMNERGRRRVKSDSGQTRVVTEAYITITTPPKGCSLSRRHTIATTAENQNADSKQERRAGFYKRYLSEDDDSQKGEPTSIEKKEISGGTNALPYLPKEDISKTRSSEKEGELSNIEENKNKKEKGEEKKSVSKLKQLFLGKTAPAEKKTRLRGRRAKTIAGGISPDILKEIEMNSSAAKNQDISNGSIVTPALYVANVTHEETARESNSKSSQLSGKDVGNSKKVLQRRSSDLQPQKYLSMEPEKGLKEVVFPSDKTEVGSPFEEDKPKDRKNPEKEDLTDSTSTKCTDGTSDPKVNEDSGIPIKDQCLHDYLTTIQTLAGSPNFKRKSPSSLRSSLKRNGTQTLNRDINVNNSENISQNERLNIGLSPLVHSWSTSDLDKIFNGGESSKIPHAASQVELSSADFDEISSSTTRLQSLTEGRTKARPKRSSSKSLNPLKSLMERTDLRTNTEEPENKEEQTSGFEKPKKRSTPRKKRSELEPWRRHTLDPVALAALAGREDYTRVSLRKTKGPGKEKDEFDGSLPVMLLQIKGRRQVQTRLVEPKQSSLNSGDCFILVTPKEIFCWIGKNANTIERAKAVEISSKIQKRGDLNCKTGDVLHIDEARQGNTLAYRKFCKVLEGDSASPIQDCQLCPEDEFHEREVISTNRIYKLQEGEPPHLVPIQELCGHMPNVGVLNTKEVLVFDFGSELYLWTGQQSLSGKRKVAFHLAQMLYKQPFKTNAVVSPIDPSKTLKRPQSVDQVYHDAEGKECGRPPWTLFARLHEKAETILFQEKFFDWPDPTKIIKMKGHISSGELFERPPVIELKPCDVTEMQKPASALEPIVLESTNLGRGLGTPNVEVDGVVTEGDLVTTLGMTVWLITQNKHFVLPKRSEGHFHSGDGYVIRWVYFVAKNRIVRDKRGRVRPLTGRQRCAYFFWQGNECSVNEKGAAAIMAVELDEERGPQVRVVEGKELPHFLKLFDGAMVIHSGKRVRTADDKDNFSDNSTVRMYCIRNEDTSEGCLVQVRKSSSSLRSRSSFVVVDSESGNIFVWHGCKASEYHRKAAERAAKYIEDRRPTEMNLSGEVSIFITEIEESQEPELFWKTVGGRKTSYVSLIKEPLNYDFTPRLFHLTSATGHFLANEMLCPSRHPGRTCPFPVVQEDLYSTCQPAMFMLDVGDELYVWEGWMPLEITKDRKGSAKRRWDEERKLTLQTALSYVQKANNRIKKGAFVVQAGLEPVSFTSHFPFWERKQEVAEMKIKEGRQDCEKRPVKEVLDSFSRKYYSFQELTGDSPPDGIDPSKLETYLNEEEFEKIFEMKRDLFNQFPRWKQDILKKALGLF